MATDHSAGGDEPEDESCSSENANEPRQANGASDRGRQ